MRTETWKLDGDRWVICSEDLEKAKEALQHPALHWMGTYYRRSGEPFAWQFVGPKEAVLAMARRKRTEPPADEAVIDEIVVERGQQAGEKAKEERKKLCAYCGEPFVPKSNFERYCSEEHKRLARREQDRARKKKHSDIAS